MQKPLHKRCELIITLYVQIQWGEEKKILFCHRGKKYILSSQSVQQNVHRNQQNLLPNFHISCLCLYFPTHTRELMGKGGGRELVILFHFFFLQRLFNHDHYIVNGQPKNNIKKTAWKRNGRIDVKEEREVNNNKTEAKMCSDLPTPFLKIQKNKPPAWIEFNKESSWAKNCTCSTGIGIVPPQPAKVVHHLTLTT